MLKKIETYIYTLFKTGRVKYIAVKGDTKRSEHYSRHVVPLMAKNFHAPKSEKKVKGSSTIWRILHVHTLLSSRVIKFNMFKFFNNPV